MAEFTIKSKAYLEAPVFDLHLSGKDLAMVEMSEEVTMAGSMKVYSFDTKNDAELKLLIRRVRGDLQIIIPEGWDVSADLSATQATFKRLPRVDVYQSYKCAVLGYVDTDKLNLKFFKINPTVKVEVPTAAERASMGAHW